MKGFFHFLLSVINTQHLSTRSRNSFSFIHSLSTLSPPQISLTSHLIYTIGTTLKNAIGIQLIYNVVLVSGVQQSESLTCVCVCFQLFATPWTVCSLADSFDHGNFQARILEWVAISYSWGSSQLRDQTHISCVPCTGRQNQLYLYIHPLFFLFFSQIGHYRVLSIVPWALQQVLISYLFYIQQGIYVNLNLWNNLLIHLPASILEIHQYPSSQQAFEDEEQVTILHKVFVDSHCS